MTSVLLPALEPPLDPSGDEGRSLLRRELARPEYHDTDVVDRILDWLGRLVDDSIGAAEGSPTLLSAAAILVAVALAAAVLVLASRARRTARAGRSGAPALTDEVVTAAELRARAEAALAAGDNAGALVDAFRALAVRQVERDRIDDVPQATAHELAAALAAAFPGQSGRIHDSADVFDQVLYGDRPATREQAVEVLALDDELAGRRVRR
ncbi:DUF4129 domain-containing protein [Nocardioides sp. SYSU DS0651]|uniref:DUF4129 domain-containing protein n=1 Tax=Nocardioides sp. SYSU DS0651 TaxID=3415955 RepID=UPI003F4B282F